MSPLRETQSSWKVRSQRSRHAKISPSRRYYLIFEGTKTEVQYFNGIVKFQRELKIPSVDVAINQEHLLNQDNQLAFNKISSNIGFFLTSMRETTQKI